MLANVQKLRLCGSTLMERASVFVRLTHKEAEPEPVKAPPEHASTTDEESDASSSDKDPFARFPDNTNPQTGEVGGPTGPEPTRYGDWERKGRVSDF
uniref:Succinate dehydrogenase assembly factor 4, mitochondrial n=1 Tax=Rhipicephalus zambeziensis TaxID=60191 RepID=A0A224YQI9_9ACAR